MASLNTESIPGVGTGILYPKLKNRFTVRFFATVDETPELSHAHAVELLNVLSTQVTSVRIPTRHAGVVPPLNSTPRASNFRGINTDGKLTFVFEDDSTNELTESLDFVFRDDVSLNALIVLRDVDGSVLEAYLAWGLTTREIEHGGLDYASSGVVTKTLMASSKQIQHAYWSCGKPAPEIQDLIKQII